MGHNLSCISSEKQKNRKTVKDIREDFLNFNIVGPTNPRTNRNIEVHGFQKENDSELKKLILQALTFLKLNLNNSDDTPDCMLQLSMYSEREDRWLEVMEALVNHTPETDPLAPFLISVIVERCSLVSKQSIKKLISRLPVQSYHLSRFKAASENNKNIKLLADFYITRCRIRNTCILIGCLAEKLTGPSSVLLLTEEILDFLFYFLSNFEDLPSTLFALVALEKFSLTSENKSKIANRLKVDINNKCLLQFKELGHFQLRDCQKKKIKNPLTHYMNKTTMEKNEDAPIHFVDDWNINSLKDLNTDCDGGLLSINGKYEIISVYSVMLIRQIEFASSWIIDNLFFLEGRPYTYENIDTSQIEVMLNQNDCSEYLKISPDGLEARSDSMFFESIRATFRCHAYEVVEEAGENSSNKLDDFFSINEKKICNRRNKNERNEQERKIVNINYRNDDDDDKEIDIKNSAFTEIKSKIGIDVSDEFLSNDNIYNRNIDSNVLNITYIGSNTYTDNNELNITCTAGNCSIKNLDSREKELNNNHLGGAWYYEITVITSGIMQIGWSFGHNKFISQDGIGIGDDDMSIGYDGCRSGIWYNANCHPHVHRQWIPGDVIGFFLDLDNKHVVFSLNGDELPPFNCFFDKKNMSNGYYAAASLMSFQQCRFNFGSTQFQFAPKYKAFRIMNQVARLDRNLKIILPKHLKLAYLKDYFAAKDCCSLCADRIADTQLLPCLHRGYCETCALQLITCPICREYIIDKKKIQLSPS